MGRVSAHGLNMEREALSQSVGPACICHLMAGASWSESLCLSLWVVHLLVTSWLEGGTRGSVSVCGSCMYLSPPWLEHHGTRVSVSVCGSCIYLPFHGLKVEREPLSQCCGSCIYFPLHGLKVEREALSQSVETAHAPTPPKPPPNSCRRLPFWLKLESWIQWSVARGWRPAAESR